MKFRMCVCVLHASARTHVYRQVDWTSNLLIECVVGGSGVKLEMILKVSAVC